MQDTRQHLWRDEFQKRFKKQLWFRDLSNPDVEEQADAYRVYMIMYHRGLQSSDSIIDVLLSATYEHPLKLDEEEFWIEE